MDKEDVVHTSIQNGILFSHRKWNEILPLVPKWMALQGIVLNEISQTNKRKISWFHLYVKSNKYINK